MIPPFFGPVQSTVTGTPGAGSITPNTAVAGALAFSVVPTNSFLFLYITDGSAWENSYSLWNGTTLTRVLVNSSTGSLLSLTSAAIVAIVPDPWEVQPHVGGPKWGSISARAGSGTPSRHGLFDETAYATLSSASPAATNLFTQQHRMLSTSPTTASATCGMRLSSSDVCRHTTAFFGGFDLRIRMGASQLPTGPRLFLGLNQGGAITTAEPSSFTIMCGFGKDSTDTNIQFMVNDSSGTATKTDTGIAFAVNDYYDARVWCNPGGAAVYGVLRRLGTGTAWLGNATTDLPNSGSMMNAQCFGGLSATTGTAFIMGIGSLYLRTGGA